MHKPIVIRDLSLSFKNKLCFDGFSTSIYPGDRIAIIGKNGSGKSSLLQMIRGSLTPSSGDVVLPEGVQIGYVGQIIEYFNACSGAERFNQSLSKALAQSPDLLLLDEPTNHLDSDNRKSLMRMLKHFQGTVIVVSHDAELIGNNTNILWHIDDQKVTHFHGSYDDYIREQMQQRTLIEKELVLLKREKKNSHHALMKEQKRAASSKAKGHKSIQQRKWPTVVSKAKATRAEKTHGTKKSALSHKRQELTHKLSELWVPEVISAKFSLPVDDAPSGVLLQIAELKYSRE